MVPTSLLAADQKVAQGLFATREYDRESVISTGAFDINFVGRFITLVSLKG